LFQKSINYEQSGDFKKALDYRVRALDEYVAIIKGKRKSFMMEKFECFVVFFCS
jgi:hypothetical protein